MNRYYVYIMASRPKGATYIGVTSNLSRRITQHAEPGDSYASRYGITRLVYFEEFQFIDEAIAREKELKKWKRQWKFDLIETENPDWHDLSEGFAEKTLSCHSGIYVVNIRKFEKGRAKFFMARHRHVF